MTDQRTEPEKVRLKTRDGREIEIECPICGGQTFITARAPASEEGAGFQHVIAGREVRYGRQNLMLTLPVRCWACSNCGYVLKFLILEEEEE